MPVGSDDDVEKPTIAVVLTAFDRAQFLPGDIVPDGWLEATLAMVKPRGEFMLKRDSDRWDKLLFWLRDQVRDHRKLHLRRVDGGMRVLRDEEVASHVMSDMTTKISNKAERSGRDLAHVRVEALDAAGKAELATSQGRVASLQRFIRKTNRPLG